MILFLNNQDGTTRKVQLHSSVLLNHKGEPLTQFRLHEKIQETCVALEGDNFFEYYLVDN